MKKVTGYTIVLLPGLYNEACEKKYGSIEEWCKDVKVNHMGDNDDIMYDMLKENEQTATMYDNETGVLTTMYKHSIPEELAREYLVDPDINLIFE